MELSLGHTLLTGLAVMCVAEGLLYAFFPDAMRRIMATALTLPPEQLRFCGLGIAVLGAALLWAVMRLL